MKAFADGQTVVHQAEGRFGEEDNRALEPSGGDL